MATIDPAAGPTPESTPLPDLRPQAPQRPVPAPVTWPLEVRTFRRTFSALPGQVHEAEPGDADAAARLRARWRSEYAFLYLGVQDDLDAVLQACDRLADHWVEEPTETNREWLVDALIVAQSVLIEQLDRS